MKVSNLFKWFVTVSLMAIIFVRCQTGVNSTNQFAPEDTNLPTEEPEPTKEPTPEPTETSMPTDTPAPTESPSVDINNVKFKGAPIGAGGESSLEIINIVNFSPDGEKLAFAGSGIVEVWSLKRMRTIAVLDGHTDEVEGIVWTPAGNGIISASLDGTVILWEIDSSTQSAVFQTGLAYSLDISPDGSKFVIGQESGNIQFWDIASEEMIASLNSPTGSTVKSISWLADGSMVACGEESGDVYIIDPDTHEIIHTLNQDEVTASSSNSLAWSLDGKILASGHQNGAIFLWDTDKWELINTFDWNGGWVSDITWLPNSSILTISGETPGAMLWDIDSGENISRIGVYPFLSSSWSPNGKYLALSGSANYKSAGHESINGVVVIFLRDTQ